MPTNSNTRKYSGDDPDGERYWFAYFGSATSPILAHRHSWRHPGYEAGHEKETNAEPELMAALQSIAFSTFTLEFRIKRALAVIGVGGKQGKKLEDLIDSFWCWVDGYPRRLEPGECEQPDGWAEIVPRLHELRQTRNMIGHADVLKLKRRLGIEPLKAAATYHGVVVDAIRLINWGTGYTNDKSKSLAYWDRLKLWPEGPPRL